MPLVVRQRECLPNWSEARQTALSSRCEPTGDICACQPRCLVQGWKGGASGAAEVLLIIQLPCPGIPPGGLPSGTGSRITQPASGGHAPTSDELVPPGPATAPRSSTSGARSPTGPGGHEPEPGSTRAVLVTFELRPGVGAKAREAAAGVSREVLGEELRQLVERDQTRPVVEVHVAGVRDHVELLGLRRQFIGVLAEVA